MFKVVREVEIKRTKGCIVIEPSCSVYILVPSEIRKTVRDLYNIDMCNKQTQSVKCELIEATKQDHTFRLLYTLRW